MLCQPQERRSDVVAIDQNQVRLTGENSFVRLAEAEGADPTTQLSHWRIHISPVGPGHALFLKSELTDNEVRIYSDNIALARWLQEDIEASMRPDYTGLNIPVVEAEFFQSGDARSFWTESAESETDLITLTWYDFEDPFVMTVPPSENPGQPHGIYTVLVPARRAQVTINGEVSAGGPTPMEIGGKAATSCCLALSETWVIPP